MKRTGLFLALVSVLAISILSCDVEIGLGASVDTRAPELTIQNPPAGSVIRDAFAMSGTCGDDGTIASISVELKHTESGEVLPAFEGTFNQKEGTWSCEINPLDEKTPVPDGSYEATVTIKDGSERETIRTRAYTIDNTAPVLAITRPSSVIPTGTDTEKYPATDYDSYGQDLIIEGHVADTCERRFISVDIYDMKGEKKYSTLEEKEESSKYIKIDSDFSTTIASSGDSAYTLIYGDDDEAGTKMYYCKITVYDSARKYPLDSSTLIPEDLLGNSADYFYMYEGDLYDSVFDTYGMTNAYKLLNGSFEDDGSRSADTTTPEEAKLALENVVYQETMGFLSLNPKNNPYFKVSGIDPLDAEEMENGTIFDNTDNHITNNSSKDVEFSPGLDQTPLKQETLGIYLLKADDFGNILDSNGNIVELKDVKEEDKIWLLRPLKDKDGNAILTEEKNAEEIAERESLYSKSGSTQKFTITITTTKPTVDGHYLFSGDKYLFGVQGYDKKNVPVKNTGTVFGFKLVESGTAPALTIKSVSPKYITTNTDSVIEDAAKTVKVTMAFAGDSPFRLKRGVNDGEEVEIIKSEDNFKEFEKIDEYTPTEEEIASGQVSSGKVSIRYVLTGNNNLTNYAEDFFYIDNEPPAVISLEVPDTKKTENSSFKFSGEVSDGNSTESSKIAEVQMKITSLDDEDNLINDAEGNPVASEWVNVGDTDKWNHIVVFQSADDEFNKVFTVEGKKKVEVRAIDTAGNISEIFTKTFLYDTDSPNLAVQTYKMGNDAEQAIKNNFFISKGFSISGTVEDGYGIESLILQQTKEGEDNSTQITIPVDNNGNWTIENLPRNNTTNEVLLETGVYSFVITAKDLAGKEEKSATYKAEIDRDKPVVTITSPADGSTVSGTNFRFTGTLNDEGTGVTSYSYKFVKAGANKNTVAWTPENTTSDEWSFYKELSEGTTATSSSLCEGEWSLFVRTVDGAGNESVEVEHKFTIDKNIPSLEANITNSPDCIYNASNSVWYYSDELSGTISYSDTFAMDSSKPCSFIMGDVDITAALDISDGTWTINSSRFNAIEGFDSSSLNNTQKVLSIIVKDKVGRTNSKTFTVYKDTQAPDAVITYPEQDAPISDAQFTARGSISDGIGVGIDSFVYRINGGAYQPLNSEIIGSTWSKAFDFEGQPEGEVTLEIMATDKLGNEAAASSVTFFYDKQNPQISISDDNIYYENASSYTLSGTAYDTNRLSHVTIQDNTTTYSSAGTNPQITLTGVDTAVSEATAANWSKIFTTGSNGILKDGLHTFRVTAYDSSNRVSTTLTKELFVDTTAPVISSIVTPSAQDTEESYYQFSGMAADNTPSNAVSQNAASGIEKIMVMFADKNIPATKTAWLEATGTTRWNLLVTYADATFSNVFGSNQGEKVIYVKAIDMAGNESVVEERTFVYDKAQPAVSISSYTIGSNNTPQLLGATTQFDVSNAFSLSGTASDTYKLKSIQVFQKKDDGEDQLVVEIPATTTSCNWTVSGLPRAENSFGSITGTADTETDATYRYYVKVFDDSSTEGKTSQTSPITVRIDKTAPTVTITSPAEDFATANDVISGSSKIFEGTAVDNENGSGLASYSYAFSQNNTAPAANSNEWTTINAENGNWSIRRDLLATATTNTSPESLTQGEWYLFVKAVDKAGNAISSPVTRHFWVDQSAPSLSNVNIEGGVYYYNTNTLTLTGNAFDSNALAANDAVVIKSGDTVLETIPGSDVAANGNWSLVLTADDIPVNESTAITIEVKDCVGRTSGVSSYTVCRDMTSPVVTASLATDAERVYQKSVNYTFSGTATDANLADVTAVLYKNGIATEQETALSPRGTDGAWEWKVYDLEEAYYSIKITARDRANNQTEYTSGSVMIDTKAPLSTISGTSLYDSDGVSLVTPATNAAELTNGTTIDAGRYYAQTSYTLSGIITEANFENTTATLELKENGTTKNVAFTGNGTTASPYSWSYTPASLTDGTYAYSLKLTDKAGNTTTYSTTVIYDTTAPELGIDVPVQNMAYGTMPPANGTVTDAGIGIAEIKWSSNNVDWSDATMTTATNWSANLGTMDSEGPVTLYVKAKDKFGRETPRNVNFSYDLYNPQLTETDTVDEYQKAGYSFTLTGTAGDTNALDCITITEGGTNTYGSTNASDSTGTARITTQNAAVTLSENNGNTALSAESGKGKSWSITFSANDTASLSQGRHTFNITAKDSAGKTSTSEVKNIFIDTIAPQVLTAVTPTTSQTANASFRFTGTAKDNNNSSADSRVELIKVKFNSYASATATESSATTEWFDANGDTSWNYIAVFTDEGLNSVFNHEGYKTISVKAIDYAGNESAVFESPKFLYDRELPTSSINSYTAGSGSAVNLTSTPSFFANNTFKLSITANDGYSVKKIVVKQKNSGVTKTVYELDNINLASKTVEIINLPRDVSNLEGDDATERSALTLDENSSGEYEYTIEVTDVAGKSASVASVKANIDKKVPVITLTTELNADSYQGLSKTFSFTASDPKAEDESSGSGLSKYYYMFTQETGTQTVSSSGWTEKDASSSFDVIPSLVSGNTLGTNGELNEGHWYLWYYVKDIAGNTSAPTSADFWLDQGAPTLTAAITPAENSIVGSGTEFYFNSGLSGTISANDSSNVDPTLTYTINGGTAVPVTGTSWTIPASSFTAEGTYSLVFTATDQVGRTATKEFTVYKDTSAPIVEIQNPPVDSYFEQASINIRGSVNDTIGSGENVISGSGPKEIWYKTNDSAWTQLTSYTSGGTIWNDSVPLNDQGNVTLYVKAKDNLGNESTPVSRQFSYDAEAPVLTVRNVDSTQGTGYSFTLTGTAYDKNALSYVEIEDKIGTTVQGTYSTSNGTLSVTGTIADAKDKDSAITWSKTFSESDANPLEQGQHTFTIKVKDASNRPVVTETRSILVDTQAPVLAITTPSAAGFSKSEYVTFSGTLNEANFSSLVVKLYKNGDSIEKDTANITPQGNGANRTWSYTAHLSENNADYYITTTATDIVGNSADASSQTKLIRTDRLAPSTTFTGCTGLTNSSASSVSSIAENVTYYAKGSYTVSGTITEANYDRTKVTITAKKDDVDVTGEALTSLQSSLATSLTSDDDKAWSFTGINGTGSYEYNLEIEDKAGNKATYKILVVFDNTLPEITTANVASYEKTTYYKFSGTASDANFLNANAVLYKDNVVTEQTSAIEVDTTNNSWSWRPTGLGATGLGDGSYKVHITVKDKANNESTQYTGAVIIDTTKPTTSLSGTNLTDTAFASATELAAGSTYYASSTYTISGVVSDTNWSTGATATYKVDGGTESTLSVDSTTKAWTLNSLSGSHSYEIILRDSAGNSNESTIVTVSYDATAPNASIAIPDADITDPLYALSANNYSFKLSASDNGGVGVKELSYIFTQTDSLPAANADWKTDSNFTTADKYVVMNLVDLHPVDSDSANTLSETQLPEGTWYLWVKAKDKAGNITSDETITANRRKIIVDKSNPTLTVTNSLNETGTNPIYEDVTNSGYTVGGTVSDTNALAVTDTEVVEDNRVYSIEIKVDGVTATRIASSELTGTNSDTWSYIIPKASIHANGLTEVEVIAKDVVGKPTSKKYNLYYDTAAPELEVTAPVGDEQVENAEKIIKGTVRDDGYGLARLEFVLKDGLGNVVKDSDEENAKEVSGHWEASDAGSSFGGNYPIKIKGEQWFYAGQPDGEGNVAGNTALTIPLGAAEGTLKLVVTATEKVVGNHTARTETEEITFFYDAAEPNITESGSVNRITNTDFVFTGTAYDTNQLAKIEIKQGGVLKATTEANPAAGVVAISFANGPDSTAEGYNGSYSLASAISQSTQGTWKATFPASSYNDGSYQFSITATDISGKVTSVTRTIQMDKTAPANISPTVTTSGTTIDSKNWYNSRALAISVTATDTNGSGVSTAEYSTVAYESASSTADPTEAYRSWTNIPNNGSAFVGTVNLPADGANTFYVRVKDIAGNYGYNNDGLTVYIDSAAPASATVASVDSVTAGDGENQFGGTKLTNGSSDIAFTMTASDAGTVGTNATGIDTIKIIKVGANTLDEDEQIEVTESEGVWGATIQNTSVTTSGGVIARVTDKVGNSYDFTLFQIQFDNKYPKVTISNIADADTSVPGTQINGTTTISGTASDDQTLASVKLQYSRKTGATTWSDWTDTGLTNQGTIYSWSFNVNTTQEPYADGDSVRFRVLATDAAGNEGNSGTTGPATGKIYGTGNSAAEYAEVIISQDSDRPVIRISNLEMSDANQVSGATSYYWHRYGSMYGTVQDDDGSVTSVKYKIGADGDWSEESINSNGMWQISNLTDGAKDIYFEVIDGGKETFTSSLTKKPKVQDSQGTEKLGYSNSDDVVLKVKVDTADPRIVSTKYYLSDSKDYDAQTNWTAASNLAELITKSSGGNNKYLYVRIEASDLNGINTNVEKTKFTFGNVEATTTDDTDNAINKVRKISQASDGNSTITIVRIDLSQFVVGQTGQADFVATVYDNSDKYNTESVSVRIDNSAPTLSVSNYDSGVVLYGSSNNIIRLYQNGDSDVDNVYYYVTNDANYNPANHIENGIYTDFAELSGNQVGTTTSIYFDGADSNTSEYHAPKFFNIIQTLTNKTDAQMAAYDEEVSLWLWWYTVDELGNTSTPSAVSKFAFKVLPNGDKPRTFITYPAEKQTGTEAPISVGGTIRITGYTEIATDSVDAVYIQIDPNYAYTSSANLLGNAFDEENWKTELEAAISGKNVSYTIVDLDDADHYPGRFTDSPYSYAIKASGTSNWSFQLNSKQEVNSSDYVAIRAFAVSKTNKKISDSVTHVVKIDANAPLIGNAVPLQVVQYENANGTGEEVARQEYTADMYLKGNWFIEGSIEHSSGIKTATWTYPSYSNGTWTTESEDIVDNGTGNSKVTLLADKGTYDNYTFKLPIGFGGENTYGKLTYTLQITDGRESGAQTVPATISINYDNKAPILNLTRSSDNSSITLLGETGSENTITQSNGTFTIEGNVNEPGADPDQSGFSRVAMFFTREDGGVTKLVDPMLAQGNTGKDNFEAIAGLDYKAVDEGGDGLYWRAARGTIANNVITFATIGGTAIASVTNFDKIIRKGGLCKINNVIYRISNVDVSVKTVTVEGVIADITSESDMYFAVGALIIDHKSTEGGTSYYDEFGNTQYHTTNTYNPAGVTTLNDDDGDQMIESATKNGTAYNWSASINSSNILDGRVTAYFVAFDNAGNVSEKAFEANVANNAPRIAGVCYGTDSNGNGRIDDNEMIDDYHGIYTSAYSSRNKGNGYNIATKVTSLTIGASNDAITVKGALTVKPEIVGGNIGLGYTYSYTKEDNSTYTLPNAVAYTGAGALHGEENVVRDADLSITIPLTEFLNANHKVKAGLQQMHFMVWDKTEGTEFGSTSGKATISLWTNVALTDNAPPSNTLRRFYWRKNNNAIESSVHYDNNGVAQGHIELEDDWMTTTAYTNRGTSTLYDADPKVSGVVYFEGVATDNLCVEKLSIYVPGLNSDNEIVFAQRNRTQGSQNLGQFENCSTVTGVEFVSAEDVYDKKNGTNTVKWKVKVDTSETTSKAATNVKIRAGAYDRGSPSLSGSNVVYEANTVNPFEPGMNLASTGTGETNDEDEVLSPFTALYQIDIVPYITGVYRKARFNTNRARSGAVSLLREEEENTITGFNLGNLTGTTIKITANKDGSGTPVVMDDVDLSSNDLTFTVPGTAKSGYLQVTVNSVEALNNKNRYVDYNTETNAKSYDHNTLTDDRYVHIWRVNQQDTFKGSKNAVYPAMTSSSDGTLYASFTNYGQSKTYYTNQFIGSSATAVNPSSNTTGTTDGVTTVFNGYDPPEETDISIDTQGNVNVFYAANYHGGNAYNWGDDSYHNGYYYYNDTDPDNAGGIYVYDTEATSTYFGRTYHNAYRFELFTYDNELNQFKNIRVNRTYDTENTTAYVNVAYYDKLTGAIKYSYVKNADEINYTPGNTSYSFTYTETGTYAGYYATSSDIRYVSGYVKIGDNYYNLSYYTRYRRNNSTPYTYYCSFEGYTLNESEFASVLYARNVVSVRDTSDYGLPWIVIDGDTDVTDTSALVPENQTGTNNTFSFAGGWTPKVLTDNRYVGVSSTTGTGESLSLSANPNGYPVIFYMDASSGQPRIAFANSRTPNTADNWIVQGVFALGDENYDTASDYMSCVVDSTGYLHIAFQNTKGQLVYAKSTNAPTNGTTTYTFGSSLVLDDSGMWIDLTMNDTTPYISYLSRVNSYDGMKIAFYNANFDEDNNGVAEGGWETVTAALDQKVSNVRTCIESNAKANDGTAYTAAIGFCPGSDYRAAFYVGQ